MSECKLCPRECKADRSKGQRGRCQVSGEGILVARAALHLWEEPCISGEHGSGAVFFCGCPLRCVYCQNSQISGAERGKRISKERLAEIFLVLAKKGAANVNLVTPTHYTPEIIWAVERARQCGLKIPIVYNCSGYEKVETLETLKDTVDIYLTDFKYMEEEMASRYSSAPDYPQVAKKALAEMVCQAGPPVFDSDGMMTRGVIVRHLLLPGHRKNAEAVVKYVHEKFKNQVYLSLMNQYTPLPQVKRLYPELGRKVGKREYECLVDYAISLGVECAYIQEGKTAKESFIPDFDCEGV
ncbi:radical SAM protein [Blautia hydrogenotrophica]|uniref:radical SAM protein n=1 Tax=Blautia hydrogenotrophica TaxID=53443 RepID=UPI0023F52CCF|nr:radical SAM protein [Blautia hydrogenotrophica]